MIVGSDTTEFVLNDLAALYNSQTPAPARRWASFNATGSATITIRLKSSAKRALEIKPNGKSTATVQLVEGWQTVSTPLTGLIAGENRIQLVAGGKGEGLAIEWIQVGAAAPAGVEDATLADERERSARAGRRVLETNESRWAVRAVAHAEHAPHALALELVEAHTYSTGAAIHVYRPRKG